MDWEASERYIAACILAKKTLQFLPVPPKDLRRQQIYQLKVLYDLMQSQESVKISDVAHRLGTTMPSVTKSFGELEQNGYVKKVENPEDRRIINVELTQKGQTAYRELIYDFHVDNARLLADMDPKAIEITIQTIQTIYQKMHNHQRLKEDDFFV